MREKTSLGGSFTFAGTSLTVNRVGYGAMQLAGQDGDGSWLHARSRQEIIDAIHDNLRNLGLDALQVVNLRLGGFATPEDEPFEEPLSALAELKQQGLIHHIGLSTVSPRQLAEAQAITEIVCVQNLYNVAQRGDDQFIGDLAAQGIAYAGRAGVAPATGSQYSPHSRHIVCRPSA